MIATTEREIPAGALGPARARQLDDVICPAVNPGDRTGPMRAVRNVIRSEREADFTCAKQRAIAVSGSRHVWPPGFTGAMSTGCFLSLQAVFFPLFPFSPLRGCMCGVAAHLGGKVHTASMPSLPQHLADRLLWAMTRKRLNAASVSRSIGVSPKTVGFWLRRDDDPERTEPGAANLRSLCGLLDVSADFLLGRSEHECGLTSGQYIIDRNECDRPTGPDAVWFTKIPAKVEIIDHGRWLALGPEVKKRWRQIAGNKGGANGDR